MSKKKRLPPEEKIRIIEEYIRGKLSLKEFEHTYGLNHRRLQDWVRLYKARGPEGLIPSGHSRKYPPELQRLAAEEYLTGTISLADICSKYDISCHSIVQCWIKRYNSHEEFRTPNSGGRIYMGKGRHTTLEERIDIVGYCISNGKDYGKAIEKYAVSYQQVYSWVKKYEANGADSLADRRGKRSDEVTMTETEKLRAELKLKEAENQRLQMEIDLLKKLDEVERRRG